MSVSAVSAVLERSKSKGLARLVLVCIADRANTAGRAWCSMADISKRANILRKNVPRLLNELKQIGDLTMFESKGPRNSSIYQISTVLMVRTPTVLKVRTEPDSTVLKVRTGCPHGKDRGVLMVRTHNVRERNITVPPIIPQGGVLIPESLSFPDFLPAWKEFRMHRTKMRKPMNKRAEDIILTRLAERPKQAVSALELCFEKGWQSFKWEWFDRDLEGNGNGEKDKKSSKSGQWLDYDPNHNVTRSVDYYVQKAKNNGI